MCDFLKCVLVVCASSGFTFSLSAFGRSNAHPWSLRSPQASFAPRVRSALLEPSENVIDKQEPAGKGTTGLSKVKDFSESVKNFVTAGGIVLGGLWTWLLFIKKREKFPRANLTHTLTHRPLANGDRLLHLAVNVSNIGESLLSLVSSKAWVQQVLPPPEDFIAVLKKAGDPVKPGETEYLWPSLGGRETDWHDAPIEIEPGESDQIRYDFVVDAEAETVQIYTYFKNAKKKEREIGWHLTSIYDLSPGRQPNISSSSADRAIVKEASK